jgi:UDP-N-acetylmuramyl pentapeptide synthase
VFVQSGTSGVEDTEACSPSPTIERLKSLLAAGVPTIVNGDDAALRGVAAESPGAILVGRDAGAQVMAARIECDQGELRFAVADRRYSIAASSRRTLAAALAAMAVGRVFGLNDAEIADGLASYRPTHHREAWRTSPVFFGDDTNLGTATEQFV